MKTVTVNDSYTIRNYQPADFKEFVLLKIEAEKLAPTRRDIPPLTIRENLGRPNYSTEQDLLVVERAGNIVGYMDMSSELSIGRIILDCWLQPEHRRKGLATKLFGFARQRTKELEIKVAQVNIAEDNVAAKNVLHKLGFRHVKRFLELRLDMAKVHWQLDNQATLGYRHLLPGEEDKLTQLQNQAFTGTWGYNHNTLETITYRLNQHNCSPEDVILACEGAKVIGYCWTEVTCGAEVAIDERKGRIFMLGVEPNYRGRGAGKGVLLAGLAYLHKNKGLRFAELTVDSENKAACALYQSVGFELWANSLWYERVII